LFINSPGLPAGEVSLFVRGSQEQVWKLFDEPRVKELLRSAARESGEALLAGEHVIYTVSYDGVQVAVKKIGDPSTGSLLDSTG